MAELDLDLDGRLRRALSCPAEPDPSEASLGSIAAALTRRRARRRTVLGATGVVVVVVFGLTFGLLVGLPSPSVTSTDRSTSAASGTPVTGSAMCVELRIGSGPPGCIGTIASIPENAAAQAAPENTAGAPAFARAQGPASSTVVTVGSGSSVTVTLPKLASGSWNPVGIVAVGLDDQPPRFAATTPAIPTHRDAATGVTVAVLKHATRGRFVLYASSTYSCATPGPSCGQTARQWSITLNVR